MQCGFCSTPLSGLLDAVTIRTILNFTLRKQLTSRQVKQGDCCDTGGKRDNDAQPQNDSAQVGFLSAIQRWS